MKLALQILMYIICTIAGFGFLGDKDNSNKRYYIEAFVICALIIILIQRVWS